MLHSGGGTFSALSARLRVPRPTSGVLVAGFPDKLEVPLIYTQGLSFTSTTGAVSTNVFWGNGVYDPDVTGVGAQPSWFDVLTTVYRQIFVRGSRIQAIARSTSATVPGVIMITPATESGPSAMLDQWTNPRSIFGSVTINQPPFVADLSMSTQDMLALKDDALMPVCYNTSGASPLGPWDWYWIVKYGSMDIASTSTCLVDFKLTYDCVATKRESGDDDVVFRKAAENRARTKLKPSLREALPDRQACAILEALKKKNKNCEEKEKGWIFADKGDRKG